MKSHGASESTVSQPPQVTGGLSSSEFQNLLRISHRQASKFGLSQHEADDLGQSVLIELLTTKATVTQPRAWVRQVARRKAWQMILHRRPFQGENVCEDLSTPTPELAKRIDLFRALERLSQEELHVWIERRVMRRTIAEVADAGSLSASTVKRRLERATSRVKRALQTGPLTPSMFSSESI